MNNIYIIKAFKLVDSISLEQDDKKYNPTKVPIDSNDSDISDCLDLEKLYAQLSTKIVIGVIPRIILY